MGGIFTWLLIGVVLYLLLSKKGGMMGCCGGNDHHGPQNPNQSTPPSGISSEPHEKIIDLKKQEKADQGTDTDHHSHSGRRGQFPETA